MAKSYYSSHLSLTRNIGQEIIIHEDGKVIAVIQLEDVRGSKSRIGIVAHRTVQVDRREVYEKKKEQGEFDSLIIQNIQFASPSSR